VRSSIYGEFMDLVEDEVRLVRRQLAQANRCVAYWIHTHLSFPCGGRILMIHAEETWNSPANPARADQTTCRGY
jgi:hypothetical protein